MKANEIYLHEMRCIRKYSKFCMYSRCQFHKGALYLKFCKLNTSRDVLYILFLIVLSLKRILKVLLTVDGVTVGTVAL